ncbi:unnamed protein product [Parnassius mnemosyne]|uniref:Uncharacterized protein n=1 Tax=Parnassius mnemosyne TaxID=213953 RepID=A0AAV1L2K5_9NEOP
MGKAREISSEVSSANIVLHNERKSEREIALQLKLSKTCVHGTIARYRETGTFNIVHAREGRELPSQVKIISLLLPASEIDS